MLRDIPVHDTIPVRDTGPQLGRWLIVHAGTHATFCADEITASHPRSLAVAGRVADSFTIGVLVTSTLSGGFSLITGSNGIFAAAVVALDFGPPFPRRRADASVLQRVLFVSIKSLPSAARHRLGGGGCVKLKIASSLSVLCFLINTSLRPCAADFVFRIACAKLGRSVRQSGVL